MSFRHIIGHARTPVQQSMTVDPRHYKSMHIGYPMLGVVLSVQASDDPNNRSCQQSLVQHGHLHEATVLIVNDGAGGRMVLEHVMITPDKPAGIDNYYEYLPRPSTMSLDGRTVNQAYQNTSPNELDGDWCLVGFIGGSIDAPFIMRWWPHSRNFYDPLTTGQGFVNDNGQPTALNQSGRFFERINGIEHVITKQGDIYLSTKYAGSIINPSGASTFGRFSRNEREIGGSIKVSVKKSQSFELSFIDPADGEGISGFDDSLPQTNPRPRQAPNNIVYNTQTKLYMTENVVQVSVPDSFDITSNGTGNILAVNGLKISSNKNLTEAVGGNHFTLVDGDSKEIVKGNAHIQGITSMRVVSGYPSSTVDPVASLDVHSTGQLKIQSGVVIDPAAPPPQPATAAKLIINSTGNMEINCGNAQDTSLPPAELDIKSTGNTIVDSTLMLNLNGSEVNLGSTSTLPATNVLLTKNYALDSDLIAKISAAATAVAAAGTPGTNAAAINALFNAMMALIGALNDTATTKTKAT